MACGVKPLWAKYPCIARCLFFAVLMDQVTPLISSHTPLPLNRRAALAIQYKSS